MSKEAPTNLLKIIKRTQRHFCTTKSFLPIIPTKLPNTAAKTFYSTDAQSHQISIERSYATVPEHPPIHASTDSRQYSTALDFFPEIYQEAVIRPESVEKVENVAKPYSAIPGPKELPIIGNAWRFAPVIGQYKIHELDKVMWSLYKDYGRIVKVGGLIGK